jgi:hypothetical protein
MAKYGQAAQKSVKSAMHRRKKGTLKSGSGRTVRSRKQAIAIGLSEAREKGAKVPPEKGARKSSRKSASKTGSRSRKTSRKTASKSAGATRKTSRKTTRKSAAKRAGKKR